MIYLYVLVSFERQATQRIRDTNHIKELMDSLTLFNHPSTCTDQGHSRCTHLIILSAVEACILQPDLMLVHKCYCNEGGHKEGKHGQTPERASETDSSHPLIEIDSLPDSNEHPKQRMNPKPQ